jgi:glycerol-3-phosphate dehydrogenase
VNAAGPWVSQVLSGVMAEPAPPPIRLVKGSHIVVPRLFQHDRSYVFQNADGRICFAIPYEGKFTLIGTTDEDFHGDPGQVTATPDDDAYLCAAVSAYLRQPVNPAEIVWRYAGVRPLRDDGATKAQAATRDYVLELHGDPPALSVFGGKITTYRRLAEAAMAKLQPFFPSGGRAWTRTAPLPGGDFPWDEIGEVQAALQARYTFLAADTACRLVRAYGTLAADMLGEARSKAKLGQVFGADLTEREVDWLVRTEWARTADDVLWRRSKLGLRFRMDETRALAAFLGERPRV